MTGTTRLAASADRVFAEVADLATYPEWLGIVRSVRPDGDAWSVDIGARIGPLWRTKRVRMVRSESRPPKLVRFERAELDGRTHAPWVLTGEIEVDDSDGGPPTRLTMHLHYGGAKWLPLVDRVLADEIRRAGGRLARRLRSTG